MSKEEQIKELIRVLLLVLDQSWNGALDADHFARKEACNVLNTTKNE